MARPAKPHHLLILANRHGEDAPIKVFDELEFLTAVRIIKEVYRAIFRADNSLVLRDPSYASESEVCRGTKNDIPA